MQSDAISGSGLTLPTRTEAEARQRQLRGFDPAAVYDPAHNFFDGMIVQASPERIARRRRHRARLVILAIAGACTLVCALLGFLLLAGQIPFID